MLICSIRDAAVGAYTAPFVVRSRAEAIRSFSDAVNDPKMEFGKHPGDYALWHIGNYDPDSGNISTCVKDCLIEAVDCMSISGNDFMNK